MKAAALAIGLSATGAAAEGLLDRNVSFGVLAYEDRNAPIYVGERHAAKVSGAVEYGLGPEGVQNGWDVVPAIIDIRAHQIVITYPDIAPAVFPQLDFNGYVLDFLTECVLFNGASQNLELSTQPLSEGAVFSEISQLYIDMSGIAFGPETYIVIDLDVAPCPIG